MLAPAKLNLYLHVLGRRADGYHLLDSLIAFVDIGDEIEFGPASNLNVAITGPFAAELAAIDPKTNLVWRAAELLARALRREPGALIVLRKNLPLASGIGGGSSDAAATLLRLSELWDAEIDAERLRALAAQLGADVPACLAAGATFLGGIGELLAPAPKLPETHVVLVNPRRPLPTPEVYKSRQGPFGEAARFDYAPADAAELASILQQRRNDLTDAARRLMPEIDAMLDGLAHCAGALLSRMSGSGATCFALFARQEEAEAAAAQLRAAHPDWWAAAGRLLG